MPILAISRDTLTETVDLVRILSSDSLATISATGYLTSQASVISALNHGTWDWRASDQILISYDAVFNPAGVLVSATNAFFQVSSDFASLVARSLTATASVTLNTAAVLAAYATPQLLIPSPGVGKAIMILAAEIVTEVATAFATGGVGKVQYGTTVHGAGLTALDGTTPAAEITAATSQVYTQYGIATGTATPTASVTNLGIYFSNATGAYTVGTGSTVTFNLNYMVINAV